MTGRRALDKQRTRERISQVATTMFLERGFDEVTVAQVAAAAGVSKVTVFAHFGRKEDLLLDLEPEAVELLRAAVRERRDGEDPVTALRQLALDLVQRGHPLSGLSEQGTPFLRVVSESPALLGRAREMADEVEQALFTALRDDPHPVDRPRLVAALVLAAYRTIVTESVLQLQAGGALGEVTADHERRLHDTFDVLESALRQTDTGRVGPARAGAAGR